MILVENLFKTFKINKNQQKELGIITDEVVALDRINFKCEAGKVTGLLGPNGAGKTTTLRNLARL